MRCKITILLIVIAALTIPACTFERVSPSPAASVSIPPSTPAPGNTPLSPATNIEPGEENAITPVVTEEIPIITENRILTPWEQRTPAPGSLLLWYALPSQSPVDLAFNRLVDDFNAQNTNGLTVYAFNLSAPDAVLSRTLPLLDTPDVPALVAITPEQLDTYGESLLPLDSLLDSETWGIPQKQRIWTDLLLLRHPIPDLQNSPYPAFTLGGTAVGLAYNSDWMARLGFYNAPQSPGEFAALVCKAVQRPYRPDGKASGYAFVPSLESLRAWTQIFGGSLYNADIDAYDFNQEAVLQAVTFLKGLYKQGCMTLAADQAEAQQAFQEGEALLIFQPVDLLAPEHRWHREIAFNWQVDTLPGGTLLALPPLTFAIPRATPERELSAWLFLKYASSAEAQNIFSNQSAWFPLQTAAVAQSNLPARYGRLYKAFLLSPPYEAAALSPAFENDLSRTLQRVLQGNAPASALQRLSP
ncbi:MAG: hypothetical protein Fur0018_27990 [Anaerolineales bacterium]